MENSQVFQDINGCNKDEFAGLFFYLFIQYHFDYLLCPRIESVTDDIRQ